MYKKICRPSKRCSAQQTLFSALFYLLAWLPSCAGDTPATADRNQESQTLTHHEGSDGASDWTRKSLSEEHVGGRSSTPLKDGNHMLLGGIDGTGTPSRKIKLATNGSEEKDLQGVLLTRGRTGHSATMLSSGLILVVGGVGERGETIKDVELINPEMGGQTQTTKLTVEGRYLHTATLLTDGTVLLTGGKDKFGNAVTTVDMINADLSHRSCACSLSTPRSKHSALLLPSGDVLISGGEAQGQDDATADLFRTKTGEIEPLSRTEHETLLAMIESEKLAIAGSLPEKDATDVSINTTIGLRFSHPIRSSSIQTADVSLIGPQGPVDLGLVYAESGSLLFLRPVRPLMPGSHHTIYVSGLSDDSNAPLALSAISFTTHGYLENHTNVDDRLPRPSPWRDAASATPISLWSGQESRESTADDWEAANYHFFDDEIWVPATENLHGVWHRNKPEHVSYTPLTAGPGITALSGRALRLNGLPLAGVVLRIDDVACTTDAEGRFLLPGLKAGAHSLAIDATHAGRKGDYGLYFAHVKSADGVTTQLPYDIWLGKLDPQGTVAIPSPTKEETVVTTPSIPGLELHLPAGTIVRDSNGNIVTEINITAVPVNQPPFPLPFSTVPVYFTIQPGGATLQGITVDFRGARIFYPNYEHQLPGAKGIFWNYDAIDRGWYTYGMGTINKKGTQSIPDPGVVVYELTGAMFNGGPGPGPGSGPPCPACPEFVPDLGIDAGQEGGCSDNSAGVCADAGSPGESQGGEPVVLANGSFVRYGVDLELSDVLPIRIGRTYNSLDFIRRQFGVGFSLSQEAILHSVQQYAVVDLIQVDGTTNHFIRTDGGDIADFEHAVFKGVTPGTFYAARISYNLSRLGWDITQRDGTYRFYTDNGPVMEIVDRNGNSLKFSRQSGTFGPVNRIDSSNGRWVAFTLDGNGCATQAQDNAGRVVSYVYDSMSRLQSVTDAAGGTRIYTYTSSNQIKTLTNADGNVILTNTYDGNNMVSSQTLADGSTFGYSYFWTCPNNFPCFVSNTLVTDRIGNVRSVFYDPNGVEAGPIVKDVYALGNPNQQTTLFAYDTNGFLREKTDLIGRKTDYTYDVLGNTNSTTWLAGTPNAVTMSMSYTSNYSQVANVVTPMGRIYHAEYDAHGNRVQQTDPNGQSVQTTYDAQGRPVLVQNALQQNTIFSYVGADLSTMTDPNGLRTSFLHDAVGRVSGVQSPTGLLSQFEYDAMGRELFAVDPLGNTSSFTWNKTGKLLAFTDPKGNTTTQTFSTLGQLLSRMDPLSRSELRSYDSSGRRSTAIDRRGQIASIAYDAIGRVSSVGFGASAPNPNAYTNVITLTYDSANRLTYAVDSNGIFISRTYDGLNRIVSESTPAGTVTYVYDRDARLISINNPDQPAIVYGYDLASRLISINQGNDLVAISYDMTGRRATVLMPSGVTGSYTYTLSGQVAEIAYTRSGTTVGTLTYAYDQDGRVNAVGGTLARVSLPSAVFNRTYDSAGEMTMDGNQIATFDAEGNLAQVGNRRYVWNSQNQLSAIFDSNNLTASFQYLPDGRRFSKTVSNQTTRYLYAGTNYIQEQSGSGSLSASILVGTDTDDVYARTTSSGRLDYLSDATGTVTNLIGAGGNIVSSYTYSPYGAKAINGNDNGSTRSFDGGDDDGDALMLYRFRYYDPNTSRFISSDPEVQSASLNPYAFVNGNPLSFIDPFGLDLSPAQQAAIHNIAQGWAGTPYLKGGQTKKGADCSGATWGIYSDAGLAYTRGKAVSIANDPHFYPVPAGTPLEIGDVGVYWAPSPHAVIYDPGAGPSSNVWTAHHPDGPSFGPGSSTWFGSPTWYRWK